MKTIVGLLIFTIAASSCSTYSCPTYDGVNQRSATMASAKKSKPAKNRVPYYKAMTRQAEKD